MGVTTLFLRFEGEMLMLECTTCITESPTLRAWKVMRRKGNLLPDGRSPRRVEQWQGKSEINFYVANDARAGRSWLNSATLIPVDDTTFYGRCALRALAEGNVAEARQWAGSVERTSTPGPVVQNGAGRIDYIGA